MKHSLLIRTIRTWDGKSKDEYELGMFRVRLPNVSLPFRLHAHQLTTDISFMHELHHALKYEIAEVAESTFGFRDIDVEIKELRFGSLDFVVVISVVGAAAYNFVKDYKTLRGNISLLIRDLKRVGSRLENKLNKMLREKKRKIEEKEDNKNIHRMRTRP